MGEIIELLKGEDGAVWSALLRTRLKANIVQKHSQTNQIVIPYPLEIKSKTKDNISKNNTDDKTDISMKHTMNTKNLGALQQIQKSTWDVLKDKSSILKEESVRNNIMTHEGMCYE